mmetsp:Transcript_19562/g.32841  ORF Transcript_19562/g.32841 Transcript_19562/m.32841 type:complete len:213 (+) Transcript_19562:652-1290(+)
MCRQHQGTRGHATDAHSNHRLAEINTSIRVHFLELINSFESFGFRVEQTRIGNINCSRIVSTILIIWLFVVHSRATAVTNLRFSRREVFNHFLKLNDPFWIKLCCKVPLLLLGQSCCCFEAITFPFCQTAIHNGYIFMAKKLEHPPSSGSHEVSKYVLINDHVIAVVHCTSPRICLEGCSVWNVPRVQGRVLYSLKHIHVCCSGNMLFCKVL